MAVDYLTLRENFRTGIDPVDRQHGEMIECYGRLEQAVGHRAPQADRVAAFDRIVQVTRRHFLFEEQLLETHGYPDLDRHRAEHGNLLAQIEDWAVRLRVGNLNLSPDTMRLVRDWLLDHMVGSDLAYVPFLSAAERT